MSVVILFVNGFGQRIAAEAPVFRQQGQKAVDGHVGREDFVEYFIKVQFTVHQGSGIGRIAKLYRDRAGRYIILSRPYIDKSLGDFAGQSVYPEIAAVFAAYQFRGRFLIAPVDRAEMPADVVTVREKSSVPVVAAGVLFDFNDLVCIPFKRNILRDQPHLFPDLDLLQRNLLCGFGTCNRGFYRVCRHAQ